MKKNVFESSPLSGVFEIWENKSIANPGSSQMPSNRKQSKNDLLLSIYLTDTGGQFGVWNMSIVWPIVPNTYQSTIEFPEDPQPIHQ